MPGQGTVWSRDETLTALFLYLTLPAKIIDDMGEDIRALARALGRASQRPFS